MEKHAHYCKVGNVQLHVLRWFSNELTGEQTWRYMFHASLRTNSGQTHRLYFGGQELEKDGCRRSVRSDETNVKTFPVQFLDASTHIYIEMRGRI